jgi:hypothetical protein
MGFAPWLLKEKGSSGGSGLCVQAFSKGVPVVYPVAYFIDIFIHL